MTGVGKVPLLSKLSATPVKVSGTTARLATLPFSTPLSPEIINAPRYEKVKMLTVDIYDGATDPEEYLGVYKAQMYVQDVGDGRYCHYFPATLTGVAHSWFDDLPPGNCHLFPGLS